MFKYIFFAFIVFGGIFCNSQDSESLYNDVDITELTPKNFENVVLNDEDGSVWMVVFYAPWCYYSQELVPEFTKAAKVLRGVVEFGAINGDKYEILRDEFDVPGFPFIKIFGKDKNTPIDFLGEAKAIDIIRAGWTAELNNWFET